MMLFAGLALYDEEPDPELVREMAQALPEPIEPGNAWIVMLGFAAPEGVSPYAYGEEKLQKLKTAVTSDENEREVTAGQGGNASELKFQDARELPYFYANSGDGMLPYAATHRAEIAALLKDNKELLERYETLRACPRFNEPLYYGFDAPIPSFSPLRTAQKIKLLQLAIIANQGDLTGALVGLREDMEFWRFVSRNSATLISKLIACAYIGNDLRFTAELGASRQLNAKEMQMVQDILRPFAVDEDSFTLAFRGEARYWQAGMELTCRSEFKPWSLKKLIYKSNATKNRMYADYQEVIRVAALPPQEFARKVKEQKTDKTVSGRIGLHFLYNPLGETLAVIGYPAFHKYSEKGHNLEGIRRLACLKVLAYQEKVALEHMAQFLVNHTQDLSNPYTGEAMIWDEKSRAISFPQLSEKDSINIYL